MKFRSVSALFALFLAFVLFSSTQAASPIIRKRVSVKNETTAVAARKRLGCELETAILQTLNSMVPSDKHRLQYAYYCESKAPPPVKPTPPPPTPPPVTPTTPNSTNGTNGTTPSKPPGKGKDAVNIFVGGAATIATAVLYLLY